MTIERATHPVKYPPGYWLTLAAYESSTGRLRIPVGVVHGQVLAGFLVDAEETEDAIRLTFEDVGPED